MGVFETTVAKGDEILKFIPQRAPIVMVDEFFGVQENVSGSGLTVCEDNIFCEKGELQEGGIIEHVAQSAAMRVGYVYRSRGEEVPIGFIGAVNDLKIYSLPRAGETLRTRLTVEQEVFNITLVSAEVTVGDRKAAECRMKIYLQQ